METPYKPRMIDKRSLEDGGLKHAHTENRPSFSTHHPLGSTIPPIHSTQHHGNQSQFSLFKCDYQKTLGDNCGNMHMKLNVFSLSTTVYVPIVKYCVNPCQAPLPILMDSPVYGARQPQRDICIQYLILSPPTVITFFSLLAMLSTRLAHTLFGTCSMTLRTAAWNPVNVLQPSFSTWASTHAHIFSIGLRSGLCGGQPLSRLGVEGLCCLHM